MVLDALLYLNIVLQFGHHVIALTFLQLSLCRGVLPSTYLVSIFCHLLNDYINWALIVLRKDAKN